MRTARSMVHRGAMRTARSMVRQGTTRTARSMVRQGTTRTARSVVHQQNIFAVTHQRTLTRLSRHTSYLRRIY